MANRTPQNIPDAFKKLFKMHWRSHFMLKGALDDWAVKQKWENKKLDWLVRAQRIDIKAHSEIGSDLAVARFVTGKLNGRICNEKGHWFKHLKDLPPEYVESFRVTAIRVANARLVDEGIDNFVGLTQLKSIDLSSNPKLDDFACDQLARQFRSSRTLEEINLSHNPLISIYGLDVLFRIPSIRRIIAFDTLASKHEDIDLFVVCAEDERQCDVYVHQDGKKFKHPELESLRVDTKLQIASQ